MVSEFAVVELAAALGMTTDAGHGMVGEVLEVLPAPQVLRSASPFAVVDGPRRSLSTPSAFLQRRARYVDRGLASTAAR